MTAGFDGQSVVITGASRGIGLGCAEAFARSGAAVTLISRDPVALEQAASSIRRAGGSARALSADVTDASAMQIAFESIARCDVLINNAGGNEPQAFLEVPLDSLDRLLAINVRAMFVTAQLAARKMAAQRSGVIVQMSSQMGHVGAARRTVYCMTKHAVEGLTKAMAVELAPLGIRVNSVAPTFVETPLTRPFLADQQFLADTLARIPQQRIGTIEEVVAAVMFLASPAASLITGTSLRVDGGYTAQ